MSFVTSTTTKEKRDPRNRDARHPEDLRAMDLSTRGIANGDRQLETPHVVSYKVN